MAAAAPRRELAASCASRASRAPIIGPIGPLDLTLRPQEDLPMCRVLLWKCRLQDLEAAAAARAAGGGGGGHDTAEVRPPRRPLGRLCVSGG